MYIAPRVYPVFGIRFANTHATPCPSLTSLYCLHQNRPGVLRSMPVLHLPKSRTTRHSPDILLRRGKCVCVYWESSRFLLSMFPLRNTHALTRTPTNTQTHMHRYHPLCIYGPWWPLPPPCSSMSSPGCSSNDQHAANSPPSPSTSPQSPSSTNS